MPISMEDALSHWVINDYGKGAISKKRLYEEIFYLYKKREYKGEKITKIVIRTPRIEQFRRYVSRLEIAGIIAAEKENSFFHQDSKFYRVLTEKSSSIESNLCSVYPYGYISHLSAMHWYGITDRIPKVIYFTSCSKNEWKNIAKAEITERIGSPTQAEDFIPTFPVSENHFGKMVFVSIKKDPKRPKEGDNGITIQDIGELFIDMLRYPESCGGHQHVIDTYIEYGATFKRKIISYTNNFGKAIDKARIGFIFNSVLGIDSQEIENWKQEKSNQRGGSRVLFPGKEYAETYSQEWNLSINYNELEKYGTRN